MNGERFHLYFASLEKLYVFAGLLRSTINKLKQERSITPKLIFVREGQDDASAFDNYLIEEQDVDGSGFSNVLANGYNNIMGFVSFLEEITQSVLEYMK